MNLEDHKIHHLQLGVVDGNADHGSLTGLSDNDHPQYLLVVDIDDTPVDGITNAPISSNWAFDHVAATDPHTVYRLESADHTHQSTGLQGGQLDHGLALTGLSDNDHPQYLLVANIDDTPVDGEVAAPISSNWAFDHIAAADPHTGYRLESADHNHQSTGAQAGQLDHGAALTGLTDDDHTQYVLLLGRSGGQTVYGGTASGDDINIWATSNSTSGDIFLNRSDTAVTPIATIKQASTGDASLMWSVAATQWLAGIDNSDSDSWKLAPNGTDVGSSPIITVTTGGLVGFSTTTPNALGSGTSSGMVFGMYNSAGNAQWNLRSSALAAFNMEDAGAGVNSKIMQLRNDDGATRFLSLTDAVGVQTDNIIVMTHSNGYVGIGKTASYRLDVTNAVNDFTAAFANTGNTDAREGIIIYCGENDGVATTSNRALYVVSGNGGAAVGALTNVGGTFQLQDLSDEKIKSNIRDTRLDGLACVQQIKVREFSKRGRYHRFGFVAQELETVLPEAVSLIQAPKGSLAPDLLGVSKEALVPVLVKAIQELINKNTDLEARLAVLENSGNIN